MSTTIKKLIIITTLSLLFSNLLFANTIEIWTSSQNVKKAILKSAASFKKDYGAELKVTVLSKEVTSKFKTAALVEKGPDILVWAHDVLGSLAESGLIEPINMSKKLKKAYLKVALDAFTYQGKIYGYPYDIESVALIYNKKFIKTAPKTMEEMIILAKKHNSPKEKTYGFLYDISSFYFTFPFLSAGGGYVFKNNNGKLDVSDIGLANSGAIKGANFLLSISKSLIPYSTDRGIAFERMKKGTLMATIDGPWAIADLKKSKIDYGVAPIPTLNGNRPRPFIGTHGFIIRRSSKNKDLAKELIENYLVTKEGIIELYNTDPRAPARIDAIDELSKNNPDLKAFIDSAKSGISMPNVPEMSAVWNAVGSALKLILTEKDSPQKALTTAVKQIKESVQKK